MLQQPALKALYVHAQGIVQGVGFRPFVYKLAISNRLTGWVQNREDGVHIHVEGQTTEIKKFLCALTETLPKAAYIHELTTKEIEPTYHSDFEIRQSNRTNRPIVLLSPDLSLCAECLQELRNTSDRRHHFAYINCSNCGPRYSIITALPYDRHNTTMNEWSMCPACLEEYQSPLDRRFHAQPTACHQCGPQFKLYVAGNVSAAGHEALLQTVDLLQAGKIIAIKGIGGYHLACDASKSTSVEMLRERKFRKEKSFALMVPDLKTARKFTQISTDEANLLLSRQRPIVLLSKRKKTASIALSSAISPNNEELGIMLPYAPLHVVLFELGAPSALVMTSANFSSEPIAYIDEDAFARLDNLADAFLVGERRIARRIDDSVARSTPVGPMLIRNARGYAPSTVANFKISPPILAIGADLKNTVTLVTGEQAIVSHYIGDLIHHRVGLAFKQTIGDLLQMYDIQIDNLLVVHDAHPHYISTSWASNFAGKKIAIQHHRAHIASVIAERKAWNKEVIGFAFDGAGYGDDGSIWGGEVFAGSIANGLKRVAHLLPAWLPGGDGATRFPVHAAAGFLFQLNNLPDLKAPPFNFPSTFDYALNLIEKKIWTYPTTSMGRLFDTVAALIGFNKKITFEGQAAIWLEHLARSIPPVASYPFQNLDYRPLLQAIISDRKVGRPVAEIARAFHTSVANEVIRLGYKLAEHYTADTIVLSGGVFQNKLLLQDIYSEMKNFDNINLWINHKVPANDSGISLGQAATVNHKYSIY